MSSRDPLMLLEPMPHRVALPVLGISVRFATNDREILDRIEDAFGHWRGASDVTPEGGADVTIVLHDGDEGPGDPAFTYRTPDPMHWFMHTHGSVGMADLERQVAVAYVTRAMLRDEARFRVCVLHFLVLITITVKDRTPLHASMIGHGDAALLLAGPTGSGKSTLAYAASKAGLHVYSDDAAYVQLEPQRVWGGGSELLLLADVAQRFPELGGRSTTLFPTGKHKMTTASSAATSQRPWVSRAKVCLLARTGGPARLTRVDAARVQAALLADHPAESARFGDRLQGATRWLAGDGGWQLSLSADAREAIPSLMDALKEV